METNTILYLFICYSFIMFKSLIEKKSKWNMLFLRKYDGDYILTEY